MISQILLTVHVSILALGILLLLFYARRGGGLGVDDASRTPKRQWPWVWRIYVWLLVGWLAATSLYVFLLILF